MPAPTRQRLRLESLENREVPAVGLDPTFGTGGVALDPLSATKFQSVAGVAAAPGGKVVTAGNLVGTAWYAADGDVVVARLTATGVADPAFGGGDGVATFSFDRPHRASAVAALPDGKVVVAGSFPAPGNESAESDLFVLRLNPDGTRDATFGTAGEITLDLGGNEQLRRVAVQPDGKLVLAGTTAGVGDFAPVSESRLALVRLTAAGKRDRAFGTNGAVTGTGSGFWSTGGLAIQTDGKLVVSGYFAQHFTFPDVSRNTEMDVFRFNANGTPDEAFGTGGHSRTVFDEFYYAYANAVAVATDGRIVVGGGSSYGQGLLAWFRPDGSLIQGERLGDGGQGLRWVSELAAAPGGGVVASGYGNSGGFGVERHPEPGAAADTFQLNPGGGSAVAGLLVTPDGKIVLAGPSGFSPFPTLNPTGTSLTAVRLSDPGVTTSPTTFVQPLTLAEQPAGSVNLAVIVVPLIGTGVGEGTVTFREGSRVLATVALNPADPVVGTPAGLAARTVPLAAGPHTITADYSGAATWAASRASFDVTVTAPTPTATVALSVSDDNPAVGEPVTLTLTVAYPDGSTPSGVASFYDGAVFLGSATLDAGGTATLTFNPQTTGTHALRAAFLGGESPAVNIDVTPAYTATGLSASTRTPLIGQPVTLTAVVTAPTSSGITPIGQVTFYDGRTILGTAPVVNGRAVFTAVLQIGARTLRAVYAGDARTFGSDSAALGVTVQKATTATTLSVPATVAVGEPVMMTATVRLTAGNAFPVGSVEFRDGSRVLGSYVIDGRGRATFPLDTSVTGTLKLTAVYLGCSTCAGSTSPVVSVTVGGAAGVATTTTLAAPAPAVHGQTQTLAATVTAPLKTPLGRAPAGRVDFYDGSTRVGSAAVGATGKATLAVAASLGAHRWRAVFVPGTGFAASESAAVPQTVGKAGTSVYAAVERDVIRVTVRPAFGGSPIGTVTFKDGSTVVGTAAVNGNGVATLRLSLLAPGRHRLTATYGGSSVFLGSASNPFDVLAPA